MLTVRRIVGHVDDVAGSGRTPERVAVSWAQATKRRLRTVTDQGTDVAIDLDPGDYLADGALLHDDGARLICVARTPERALVVRFASGTPADRMVERAARIGHAFGNQHVPIDVTAGEIHVPLTTSERVARATVEGLGLDDVEVAVREVRLAASAPMTSAGHAHP